MKTNDLNIVILAAGQGTRMYSNIPKVLHKLGGKAILEHVIDVALLLKPKNIFVIYGHMGAHVKSLINSKYPEVQLIYQKEQLGTAHAINCAIKKLNKKYATLVLYADVPLITVATLLSMLNLYKNNIVVLTAILQDPHGYGRIIRDSSNNIIQIVEEKDANSKQKDIKEINSGIYIFPTKELNKWLTKIKSDNKQKEYYLTDIIELASKDVKVVNLTTNKNYEILGVNNKLQLEALERQYQINLATKLLLDGVTISDKLRIDIRGDLKVGQDTLIDIDCIFEGNVIIGKNVIIGPYSFIKDSIIGDNVEIKAHSIIEGANISDNCKIGPFARIRPSSTLAKDVHIGNFVEIKQANIDKNSKINHLSYIGDATIGSNVNVGAVTVTCNYDGVNKNKTVIKDNVFVGSGSMLVAPLVIAKDSVIGAGSTITKNTKEGKLTIARTRQVTIENWINKKNKKG